MKPSIAVLGCGYWGQNHIKTLKSLGNLYAISDIDMVKANNLAKDFNVLSLTKEQLFANTEIDAIVLALPPQFHAQYAIQVLQNNKDVFIEKPIALDAIDAELVIKTSQVYNKIVMVGHILRFHSAFEKLQNIVNNGIIGDIKYINAKRWSFGKFHTESDAMWDLAPHDLSLILALTQEKPEKVIINGTEIFKNKFDFADITMEFSNSIKAFLSVSRLSPYCERKFMIVGKKAMVLWDDMKNWNEKIAIYNYNIEPSCTKGECSKANYIPIQQTQPLTNELQHFINCIKTRVPPRTCGEEGLEILTILNMLHK